MMKSSRGNRLIYSGGARTAISRLTPRAFDWL